MTHLRFVYTTAEVTRIAVFHDYAETVIVQEGVDVAHDIRVRHTPHELHLITTPLLFLGGYVLEPHDLFGGMDHH